MAADWLPTAPRGSTLGSNQPIRPVQTSFLSSHRIDGWPVCAACREAWELLDWAASLGRGAAEVEWGLAAVQGDWDAARQALLLPAAAAAVEPLTPSPYGTPHPWAPAADSFSATSNNHLQQMLHAQAAGAIALHFGSPPKLEHPSSGSGSGSSSGPAATLQDSHAIPPSPATFQDGYAAGLAAASALHVHQQNSQHNAGQGTQPAGHTLPEHAGSRHKKLAAPSAMDSGQDEVEELLHMMGIC